MIPLPDGRVGFVVGDVTDKGVPAALVMSATRSVLRASAQRLIEPGVVLERVNELLCPDMPAKMFVTCLYGVLDPASGRLRFANAGHDLPYVKTADGVEELRARGMPLGLMPGMDYEEKETVLRRATACCCTPTASSRRTTPSARCSASRASRRPSPTTPGGQALIDRVLAELDGLHRAGRRAGGRHHDGHARALSGRHDARHLRRSWPSSSCPARRATSARRSTLVAGAVAGLGLEPARLERLKTAVGEATMNAMEHGNEYRADRPVSIRVLHAGDRLRVQITDLGGAAELHAAEAPDLEAKLEGQQTPRGWGLFLIEKMVDEARVTERRRAAHARARRCAWKEAAMAVRVSSTCRSRERDGIADHRPARRRRLGAAEEALEARL